MTKEEILKQIQEMLASLFELDPEDIKPESKLFEELELDSIDAVGGKTTEDHWQEDHA